MSGWHEPQRAVRIIILFLLLFLLNPVLTKSKEVAPNHPHSHSAIIGKRNLEDSKIDIHLLYNAYRERVKEGNVETRYSPGLLHDNSAVAIAEEGEVDSMTKYGDGVRMKDLTDMSNELLEELKMVTPLPKKLDSNDHDNDKQNTLVKQETKEPETKLNEQIPKTDQAKNANPKIKSTVILKMDLPSTMNVESLNLRDQSNTARDAVERRVAELNRVFKEFIGLWRKPNGDPMHTLILGNENSDFASKPVHLNALNDLMNVVENLKQPDTVDNFVKAINDEMMRDTELVSFPNCLNFIDHLEENTPIQKEDKDLQYPGLKDSPATEFQDLVSPNKLAKQNDYQEKSDNKDSSITKHNEQSSRISKRVAVEAKSPDAKADKTKSVVTKSAESKSAKVKSTDAKIADAKTTDAKTTDAKTTDPKVAEARSAEAKSSKAKSAKVKHTETEDSKVVKAKSVEAKVDKSKSTDAEAVESKSAASAETNTVNAKSAEVKSAEVKSTDSKVADSKSADLKSAEAKAADAKITDSTSSDSAQVRSGGLYEEYKNKLREILTANDNQRKFLSKVENSGNEDRACHCDERRTLTLAVGADGATVSNSPLHCHCDASKHSNSIDGTSKLSNGHVACHCDSQTCSVLETVGIIHPKVVANKVLFAHKKKEDMEDEGPKPYFISNSKQRQMIWNDIPLSGEKKSFDNVNKNRGQMMYSQPSVAAPPVDLKPNMDHQRAPSQKNKSEVQSKKHTQLQYLVKVLQDKHRAPALRKAKKRNLINKYNRLAALVRRAKRRDLFGGLDMNKQFGSQPSFPQVFVNQPGQVQPTGANGGGRMLGMMAKQLNVSPVEMAQRIASSTGTEPVPVIENPLQYTSASQTNGFQVPTDPANNKRAPETTVYSQTNQANLGSVLDKILTRLQTIQDLNLNKDLDEWNSQGVPCCFAEPSDGSPCELAGSWESMLLGVRINIKDDNKRTTSVKKPICYRPGWHGQTKRKRNCVKLTPQDVKNRFNSGNMIELNVTLEDTVPPREHTIIDNISSWVITARAISTLGGPVTFSCRKMNSKLMGTFVGFCRNCGCIDTIFGSWSFIHPSRDCQDITMSILERRDIMRRYSMVNARRERYKEELYRKSNWAKTQESPEQAPPTNPCPK